MKTRRLPAAYFGLSGGRWQQQSEKKSLYISPGVSNFYETEIEIWAGFGPVGNAEKNWANYDFEVGFFTFSRTKKIL